MQDDTADEPPLSMMVASAANSANLLSARTYQKQAWANTGSYVQWQRKWLSRRSMFAQACKPTHAIHCKQ